MTSASARLGVHDKGRADMASSGKKKTTMAKLMRESRLRERRLDKQARKDARRQAAAQPLDELGDTPGAMTDESVPPAGDGPVDDAMSEGLGDVASEAANLVHHDDRLPADDRTRRPLHGAARND
jgi:hypothetical protein